MSNILTGSAILTIPATVDLPIASDTELGGVTVQSDSGILIDESGDISVDDTQFLSVTNAESTYLTQSNASSTYATQASLDNYAPLASPTLTGTPTAPTPTVGDNSTNIATTEFVQTAISGEAESYLPLTGGTMTGSLVVSGSDDGGSSITISDNSLLFSTTYGSSSISVDGNEMIQLQSGNLAVYGYITSLSQVDGTPAPNAGFRFPDGTLQSTAANLNGLQSNNSYSVFPTGFGPITIDQNCTIMTGGSAESMTINFSAFSDGAVIELVFTQPITSLTLVPSGVTATPAIIPQITTITEYTAVKYRYIQSEDTWYQIT